MMINRRERKKIESKNIIIKAAVKIFALKGYHDTTVADIMSEADLGIGTFYNYFATKEEILKHLLAEIIEETNAVYKKLRRQRKTAAQMLKEMVLFTAGTIDMKRFVLPLFVSAASKGTLPREHERGGNGLAFKLMFMQIIQDGQESGEFRKDIPSDVITEMFHSIFQAASFSSIPLAFMDNIKYKLILLLDGISVKAYTNEEKIEIFEK